MNEIATESTVRYGAVAGFLSALFYLGAAVGPLPSQMRFILALLFGPLAVVAWLGVLRFVRLHRDTLSIQAAAAFGMAGGVVVTLMLAVQIAIHERLAGSREVADAARRELLGPLEFHLASVHLGLDIAWDLFIGGALLFLGVAIRSHPRFGGIFAWITGGLGFLVVALNLYSLPTPPAESGLFDVGPIAGLWALVLFGQMLRSSSWARAAAAAAR